MFWARVNPTRGMRVLPSLGYVWRKFDRSGRQLVFRACAVPHTEKPICLAGVILHKIHATQLVGPIGFGPCEKQGMCVCVCALVCGA